MGPSGTGCTSVQGRLLYVDERRWYTTFVSRLPISQPKGCYRTTEKNGSGKDNMFVGKESDI